MNEAVRPEARVLVAGWFSFSGTGATVGDVMVKDVVCSWLDEAGVPYDVAIAPRLGSGVDWGAAEPSRYSHVVFVCGPFYRSDLLRRFEGSKLVGMNLSMIESVAEWNPFDLLFERDSDDAVRPDLAFGAGRGSVPVVGFAPLPSEDADQDRERSGVANDMLRRLIVSRGVAVAPIDTRLERPEGLPTTPATVESLISRLDVVVTARLHGLVLALRNGVPAVALDPVDGGGKILRQAAELGWPAALHVGEATDQGLSDAFEFCLSQEARGLARDLGADAAHRVGAIGRAFVERFSDPGPGAAWGDGRRSGGWSAMANTAESVGGVARVRALVRRGARTGVRSAHRALRAIDRRL